jgi:hypothetical protein
MTTQVTYRVDDENNAEQWWEAFRVAYPELHETDPELYAACCELERHDEVVLHDPRLIEAFDAFVTGLPGWEDGPEYARAALVAVAE